MRTVFGGGRLFDADTGTFESADLVIEDGLIVDVGSGFDGDVYVDCAGRDLLPGLFDCHVHVTLSDVDIMGIVHAPYSLGFYEAIGNLKATLEAGITTVRDAGGADLGVKEAVERGLVVGPRMQIAIQMLSQTGGHGDGWLPSGSKLDFLMGKHPGSPAGLVDGPDEMRKVVRELIRSGADVIKVATSGGVLSPRDDPRHAHFQPDELSVLVAEATSAGIRVMAHAQATDCIKNAVRAGIASIEHGIYLDEEAIDMMLAAGTYLVPTLLAPRGVLRAADAGARIPEESVRKAREVVEVHRESFSKAVSAGVAVAMGTDSGVTPHGMNLGELALMAEGGMTPGAVLQATTINAATLMGLADSLGSFRPGKIADVVVVAGDALDLEALAGAIEQVWKDGVRVR